jgi:DNA polymerase I-like protein with 3'-5' exonuclease and polymerase domains
VIEKNYTVVKTEAELELMLKHIEESNLIAYDTETTGLNVRKDTVIGFSVSGKTGTGFYLPLLSYDGVELQSTSFAKEARTVLLKLKGKKLIMHNASFDVRITKSNFDIDFLEDLHADTILLKHTVDEEQPFGLKPIAKKIQAKIGLNVEEEANKEQIAMVESIKANGGIVSKEQYELYKADTDLIGIYACYDTDITLRIFEYYSSKLEEEHLENFFYNEEVMPLLKEVTIPMESLGIPVDVEALQTAKIEIEEDIENLEAKIQEAIAPHLSQIFEPWFLWKEFPPKRSGSFAQAMCEYANLSLPKTEKGRYSLSEDAVQALEPSIYKDFLLDNGEKSEDTYLPNDIVRDIQLQMWAERGEKYMFNISSKVHLQKLFFLTLEEEPITRTDKGNPQMNQLFLDSVKDKYDFVPLIIDFNKLNKTKSTYIDRILDHQEDGIFYPKFMQHRTISGRYGSDLQQLPRPVEEGQASEVVRKHNNKVRKFFISGKGYSFIDSDYESLEPHVFSHVSGDEGLRDIFRKGNDFYSTIAIGAENLDGLSADKNANNYLGKVNKPLRQKAKAYALGIPYGMGDWKLSKTLNISQDEAKSIIENYMTSFPMLHEWMLRSEEDCKLAGKVASEAGRVRHMPLAPKIYYNHGDDILDSLKLWQKYNDHPAKYNQMKYLRKQMINYLNNAKNFQIQSLAASIVNRAAIKINRELKRQKINGYVCANIHDQLIIRVPEKEAKHVAKMVQYIMENNYKLSVDLKAPPAIAKDFYEGH